MIDKILKKWQLRPKNVITQIFQRPYILIFILDDYYMQVHMGLEHMPNLKKTGGILMCRYCVEPVTNFDIGMFLKSILFKKILAKSNSLVNLHDSAPHFGACLPEISGQNRANLLGYWIW